MTDSSTAPLLGGASPLADTELHERLKGWFLEDRRAQSEWYRDAEARRAIWDAVNPHSGRRRIDEAFPSAIRHSVRDDDMRIKLVNRCDYDAERKIYSVRPRHDWTSHAADAFRCLARGLPEAPLTPGRRDPYAPARGGNGTWMSA